jgi:hypothetical protein
MGTSGRGNAGEAAVLNALVQRDFDVLLPFGEGHPFDLVVLTRDKFVRIQCKTAWRKEGCLVFNSHATDHGHGVRSYRGLADLFGVYFPPDDSVFMVPVNEVPLHEGRLRLEPARNNQRRRIRPAEYFLIDRWTLDTLGELVRTPARMKLAA